MIRKRREYGCIPEIDEMNPYPHCKGSGKIYNQREKNTIYLLLITIF
jgi:hypothetical protein